MALRILFDHQLFSYQRYGGASKYFAMLLNALPRDMWKTTTMFSNNEYVKSLNLFPVIHFLPNLYFRGQGRIMNELNKPYSIYQLRKQDYDVFHQTHFETYCLKSIGSKPMVTTFHDINFSTLNPSPRIVKFQRESLKRADRIIAISQNTKKDVMRLFNIDDEKITVIYHGIEHKVEQFKYESLVDYPYILYVGTRSNHKNFNRFIHAFSLLHKRYSDIRVICTFKDFTIEEKRQFQELKIEDSMVHFMANEHEMKTLYQNALFFVFPSLYEGFGMPILEAMSNSCPVVLSNTSCFPEIAQDAGLYFDPKDIDDMCHKMTLMIEDEELRAKLIAKGNERVKDFSWEKCANQHIEVYKSLL